MMGPVHASDLCADCRVPTGFSYYVINERRICGVCLNKDAVKPVDTQAHLRNTLDICEDEGYIDIDGD